MPTATTWPRVSSTCRCPTPRCRPSRRAGSRSRVRGCNCSQVYPIKSTVIPGRATRGEGDPGGESQAPVRLIGVVPLPLGAARLGGDDNLFSIPICQRCASRRDAERLPPPVFFWPCPRQRLAHDSVDDSNRFCGRNGTWTGQGEVARTGRADRLHSKSRRRDEDELPQGLAASESPQGHVRRSARRDDHRGQGGGRRPPDALRPLRRGALPGPGTVCGQGRSTSFGRIVPTRRAQISTENPGSPRDSALTYADWSHLNREIKACLISCAII